MFEKNKKLSHFLENIAMRISPLLIPGLIREVISRSAAYFVDPMEGGRVGIEDRVRGVLYASQFKARGLRVGRDVRFEEKRNMQISEQVTFYGPMCISAAGPKGDVRVGERTHIDRYSVLYGQGGLKIGSKCAIAAGVIIYTQTNQYNAYPELPIVEQGTRYAPVIIGDDVWIGAGSIILPGVTIGDHAVVGAGSVVTRDIAPATSVVGTPAQPIKTRSIQK